MRSGWTSDSRRISSGTHSQFVWKMFKKGRWSSWIVLVNLKISEYLHGRKKKKKASIWRTDYGRSRVSDVGVQLMYFSVIYFLTHIKVKDDLFRIGELHVVLRPHRGGHFGCPRKLPPYGSSPDNGLIRTSDWISPGRRFSVCCIFRKTLSIWSKLANSSWDLANGPSERPVCYEVKSQNCQKAKVKVANK